VSFTAAEILAAVHASGGDGSPLRLRFAALASGVGSWTVRGSPAVIGTEASGADELRFRSAAGVVGTQVAAEMAVSDGRGTSGVVDVSVTVRAADGGQSGSGGGSSGGGGCGAGAALGILSFMLMALCRVRGYLS
jgi:hypothetical protein